MPSNNPSADEIRMIVTSTTRKFSLAGEAVTWKEVNQWHEEAINAIQAWADRRTAAVLERLQTIYKSQFGETRYVPHVLVRKAVKDELTALQKGKQ